jgi:hypothetical protein
MLITPCLQENKRRMIVFITRQSNLVKLTAHLFFIITVGVALLFYYYYWSFIIYDYYLAIVLSADYMFEFIVACHNDSEF